MMKIINRFLENKLIKTAWLFLIIFLFLGKGIAGAYSEISHRLITHKAILCSDFYKKKYLENNFKLKDGVSTLLYNINLTWDEYATIEWFMEEGSIQEDEPICRASNHFHTPLKYWSVSGLTDIFGIELINLYCTYTLYPGSKYNSAVKWGTGYIEPAPLGDMAQTDNSYDWDDAREALYVYLTGRNFAWKVVAANKDEREFHLSNCFYSLGHVLHLLQDMAVPSHTRNDWFSSHIYPEIYENFVENNSEMIRVIDPDATIPVKPPGGTLTSFWDSNIYNGYNPDVSNEKAIGLAEFTHINFASEATIFDDPPFNPYPTQSSTNVEEMINGTLGVQTVIAEDGKPDTGYWISKIRHGVPVVHFVKANYWSIFDFETPIIKEFIIDDVCARNYARILLPLAVQYSAGLIDYFFRGEIDLVPDPQSQAGYVIENRSGETMHGVFALLYDRTGGERVPIWREPDIYLEPNGTSQNVGELPMPDDAAEPGKYILVFMGKMGDIENEQHEENAVVGKVIEMFGKAIGGEGNNDGRGIAETPDGGFLIVGDSLGLPSPYCCSTFALLKTDKYGNLEWVKEFNISDPDGVPDCPFLPGGDYSIKKTSDGNYIIVGYRMVPFIDSFGKTSYTENLRLVKVDENGNKKWSNIFPDQIVSSYGYSVIETNDKHIVATGYIRDCSLPQDSDVYFVKTSLSGSVIWEKRIEGPNQEIGYSVAQTQDGGYIITGKKYFNSLHPRYGETDCLLMKTDSGGNLQWSKTYDLNNTGGSSVKQTSDGGYVFSNGDLNKTDAQGNLQWSKTYDGANISFIQSTKDGGYVMTGEKTVSGKGNDVYILKVDSEFNKEWSRTVGGKSSDRGSAIIETSDGGFAVIGATFSFGNGACDVYFVKIK